MENNIHVEIVSLQQYVGSLFGGNMISPEQLYIAIARVSSNRELSDRANDIEGLIKYCLKNKHWSIFEQVNIGFYVQCPLFVVMQILRHKTMCFQMFSQRYQKVDSIDKFQFELRLQGKTNRQSSEEEWDGKSFQPEIDSAILFLTDLYNDMVESGVSLETARNILPMCTPTEVFINTNLRTLIHYLEVRTDQHAQKEHRILANKIKDIVKVYFPITFNILESIEKTKEARKKLRNPSEILQIIEEIKKSTELLIEEKHTADDNGNWKKVERLNYNINENNGIIHALKWVIDEYNEVFFN